MSFDMASSHSISKGKPTESSGSLLHRTAGAIQNVMEPFDEFTNQAMGEAANVGAFNIPSLIQQKTGLHILPSESATPAGNAGKLMGGIAGWTMGGPEALGKSAVDFLPQAMKISSKWGPTFMKGAMEMGAGRAGFIPVNMAEGENLKSETGKTALMAAFGAGTAGFGKGLFGRQYASQSMTKGMSGVKDMQNEMYDKLYKSGAETDPVPLYQTANQAADHARSFYGKVPPKIQQWVNKLGDYVDNGKMVPAEEVEKLRQEASALFKEGTHLKTPTVQNAIRMVGSHASEVMGNMADKAGISEWEPVTEQASANWKIQNKPSLLHQIASIGLPGILSGGGTYAATGNPLLSAAIGSAVGGMANPFVRDLLFKGIENAGIGKAVRTGIAVHSTKRDQTT